MVKFLSKKHISSVETSNSNKASVIEVKTNTDASTQLQLLQDQHND